MSCDDCRFAEGVPNYVPYGSTSVLEGTYLNCLKGYDPEECPEDEYSKIDPFELMPGYQRARDAGVD